MVTVLVNSKKGMEISKNVMFALPIRRNVWERLFGAIWYSDAPLTQNRKGLWGLRRNMCLCSYFRACPLVHHSCTIRKVELELPTRLSKPSLQGEKRGGDDKPATGPAKSLLTISLSPPHSTFLSFLGMPISKFCILCFDANSHERKTVSK